MHHIQLISRGAQLACLSLLVASCAAAEWYQWRGPNRDGVSTETGLLDEWPSGGPPLVWKATGLGSGFASLSTSDGRLYTQGQRDGTQYVMALSVTDGRKLWETANGSSYDNSRGDGPRGTPTVDGDRIYATGSNGRMVCLEAATGEKVWGIDLFAKFDASNTRWGFAESPLVDGDRVIVTPGGSKAGIVALDKRTGEIIWTSATDTAGYSSPMVTESGGVRQYVTLTGSAAVGVKADDGTVLWRYPRVANSVANVATPIIHDGDVFVSTAYDTGAALLSLDPAAGGVTADEVYFTKAMQNHYSTSVLVGEYVYGYSNSIFICMKFDTGEVAWRARAVGKGQVIYADGRLYLLGENGVAALVDPSPEGYKEISRFEMEHGGVETWTLPVIAGGKLYLRDQGNLYCYDIRQ